MDFNDLCSFYFNVREQRCIEMSLEEFVNYICNGRWKSTVEMYHRLMAEGDKSKAKELKNKLPGLVVAGYCEGSHALKNRRTWSGNAMFDVDHTQGRTLEFLQKLKAVPWVGAGWRSVSYDGLKVVVRIEAVTAEEYVQAYAVVAWHIGRVIDFPCDMSCKNPTRPCYASYDEEAFCKSCFELFPWREFLKEHPDKVAQIMEELKVRPVASEPATGIAPEPAPETATGTASETASQPASEPPSGILRTFFNDFLAHNAFIPGAKNDFLLKLGRIARYKGLSDSELRQLEELAVERLSDAGCPPEDIIPKMDAGYRYVDQMKLSDYQRDNTNNWGRKDQGPSLCFSGPVGEDEKAEEERLEADKLHRDAPCFPKSVYDALPDLLVRGLKAARNSREKDRLLLGMLANLSGCLPGVWMNYADMCYTPHFYAMSLAGAGRGKGIVTLGSILPDAVQRYLEDKNKTLQSEYDKKQLAWALEERLAIQEKRVPDIDKRPEPPVKRMLKISPNISKSQLIMALEEAGAQGVVINASELDMLTNAMKQDCGKHDDVFRAAFHHEETSSYYKTDKRMVVAHAPHLALCLTGTPSQLHRFISSLENGMYSRMAFYIGEGQWEWISAAPMEGGTDHVKLFRKLSEEVLRMFVFLSGSPTEVCFTPEQWEEHTQRFSNVLQEVVSEDDDSHGAIVLRHGLIATRIAMVLTALRKCEPMWNVQQCRCTDEDFHVAMDIVKVLLEHSLLLSTTVSAVESGKEVKPMKKFYRIRSVLAQLPEYFTYTQLSEVAKEHGIPVSSLKRYLVRLIEMQIIEKEGRMYHKLCKSWPGNS